MKSSNTPHLDPLLSSDEGRGNAIESVRRSSFREILEKRFSRISRVPDARASRRIEHNEVANVSFPLTPALSPGERETRNPALGTKRRRGLAEDWRAILPLLRGEGWGEGKGGVRVPTVRAFKERFMGRENLSSARNNYGHEIIK